MMPVETRFIELTPTQTPAGTVWQLCVENTCDSKPPYPMLKLNADTGPYTIIFSINDHGPAPIRFAGKADDAIHIQPNSKPNGKKYDPGGQLGSASLSKHKQTLVLTDKNEGTGVDFHYALNFSDGSTIDPVIRNGGGTNPPAPPPKWYDVGLGDVVAVLLGLAIGVVIATSWYRSKLNKARQGGGS
jgi:hypothetical protein